MNDADAPTVISLFAGCGGSSLGYRMAGYRELLAVEWDDNAVETFRLNFPDVPVYHGDIRALTVEEVCRLADIQPGELDLLDGSPPCQGFSTAGRRLLSDDRNQLFREYCRLLKGLQPQAFIMENVSGMVKGKMRLVTAEIFRELAACGYCVKAQLMNAKWFSVPQSRERLIFIGMRNAVDALPTFPKPQMRPVTVREALKDVPTDPDAFAVGSHTKIYQAMLRIRPGESQPGHHSHIRLPLNTVSPTLLADHGFGHYHYWHPTEQRSLSFYELKRLTSFPCEFELSGSPGERWALVGNSVPPLFMKAIAEHVRAHILSNAADE